MFKYNESELEIATLEWLMKELGYDIMEGPDLAPDGEFPERN